jgi:hypothetical protein
LGRGGRGVEESAVGEEDRVHAKKYTGGRTGVQGACVEV